MKPLKNGKYNQKWETRVECKINKLITKVKELEERVKRLEEVRNGG